MHSILSEKASELAQLCQKYEVENMYAFGSVTSKHFHEKDSDLDFLVRFKKGIPPKQMGANMLALIYELEDLYDRKVDLLRDRPFVNPYFAKNVHASKTLLYAAA